MNFIRPNIVSGATRLTKELVDDITQGIADAHEEIDGRLSTSALNTKYSPACPDVVITRDSAGQVSSVTEDEITTTLTRDASGQVATIQRGNAPTQTITRDSAGRVIGVSS